MKTIETKIAKGKISVHFKGFTGNSCQLEEDSLRAFYGKMGVRTDVESSEKEKSTEANGIAERQRIGNQGS